MAAVAGLVAAAFLALPATIVGEQPEPYKSGGAFYRPDWTSERLLATRWTMTSKIDLWADSSRDLVSGRVLGHPPSYRMITQDNDAHTLVPGPKDRRAVFEAAARDEPFEPLAVLYRMGHAPERVLVIGPGGGKDVVTARAYGAEAVDAVELNPATVDLLSRQFADYAEWPTWDGVRLVVDEGRHHVRSSGTTYDAIVMSGVDTFAALSSGAYVLSENYLYTVDAMKDYLRALEPGGILGIFRWFFPQPREDLRLANLYIQAAEETGVDGPERSIMVIASGSWAATLIKNGPFTPQEVAAAVADVAAAESFSLLFVPKVFPEDEQRAIEAGAFSRRAAELRAAREAYAGLLDAAGDGQRRRRFEERYVYNITPVYDDRPFFFEYFKADHSSSEAEPDLWDKGGLPDQITALRGNAVHYVLHILLVLTATIGLLAMIVPLLVFDRQGLRIENGLPLAGYFCALGLGFMLIEIGLMQKLTLHLGHPMYSIAVVLAGVLLFAGVGAFASGRLTLPDEHKIALGMLGTAALALAWLSLSRQIFPATAGWPLAGRVGVCLVTLAPLAVLMGIPFAAGLRYLERSHPAFIPWAWGLNGLTSVLGSVAAVMVAMRAGFTVVLVAGAAVYVVGLLMFLLHRRSAVWHAAGQPSPD
jgi:hypothetical protein